MYSAMKRGQLKNLSRPRFIRTPNGDFPKIFNSQKKILSGSLFFYILIFCACSVQAVTFTVNLIAPPKISSPGL